VWLSPDFRGSGVANRLMDAVFDWAASNDFEIVRAEVRRGNEAALRFYQKYGFNAYHNHKESDQWNLFLAKAVATAPDRLGSQ
jgi:ribosomal protein S18 acetylase RimI-like enzyme